MIFLKKLTTGLLASSRTAIPRPMVIPERPVTTNTNWFLGSLLLGPLLFQTQHNQTAQKLGKKSKKTRTHIVPLVMMDQPCVWLVSTDVMTFKPKLCHRPLHICANDWDTRNLSTCLSWYLYYKFKIFLPQDLFGNDSINFIVTHTYSSFKILCLGHIIM